MEATVSSLILHWKMDPSSVAASEDENCRQVFIGGGGEKYRAVDVDDADDSGRQWRRITMEAAWGGWDGARESLESSLSFASFLFLGAMGRSMLRAALRDGV